MRRMYALRQFAAFVFGVAVAILWLSYCAGCGVWGQRAFGLVDSAQYERDLDECLKEGRATHSLAVYEACAKEADIKHGMKDGGVK